MMAGQTRWGHPLGGNSLSPIIGSLLKLAPAELTGLREQRVVWWPDAGLVYERPSVV